MVKNFTLLLFIFIAQFSAAQINFFQTGATWGYNTLEHPDTPWDPYRIWLQQITITGDTTMNNIVYKKLHRVIKETDMPGAGGGIPNIIYYDYTADYIRFDSLSKKVFHRNQVDPTERLIYDFNLSVGDTIPYDFSPNVEIVDSIENISLFGYTVKKYYIISDPALGINTDQYIIEGIGASNGLTLLEPHDVLVVSAHNVTDLMCFQLGLDVYPPGPACDIFLGVNEKEEIDSHVSVYPNPFQKSFRLNFPSTEKNMSFKIFDVMGKEVYSKVILYPEEVTDLPQYGLYIWKLEKDEKTIARGKLMHEQN